MNEITSAGKAAPVAAIENTDEGFSLEELQMLVRINKLNEIRERLLKAGKPKSRALAHIDLLIHLSQKMRAARNEKGELNLEDPELAAIRGQAEELEKKANELLEIAEALKNKINLHNIDVKEELENLQQEAKELKAVAQILNMYSDEKKLSGDQAKVILDMVDDQKRAFQYQINDCDQEMRRIYDERSQIWTLLSQISKTLHTVKFGTAQKVR